MQIGKPTLQITETAFTKALQNAIDQDGSDVRDVSNTQSLRYAVRDAFLAGHLRGFQCGSAANDAGDQDNSARAGTIELELPLTVAGQGERPATTPMLSTQQRVTPQPLQEATRRST